MYSIFQVFIVRKSSRDDVMALSVQFPAPDGSHNVDHYLIEPVDGGFHLQGSKLLFEKIPLLIAYYCEHKYVTVSILEFRFCVSLHIAQSGAD